MQKKFRILVINPGSTSTKIGVYDNEQLIFEDTLRHQAEKLAQFRFGYRSIQFPKRCHSPFVGRWRHHN